MQVTVLTQTVIRLSATTVYVCRNGRNGVCTLHYSDEYIYIFFLAQLCKKHQHWPPEIWKNGHGWIHLSWPYSHKWLGWCSYSWENESSWMFDPNSWSCNTVTWIRSIFTFKENKGSIQIHVCMEFHFGTLRKTWYTLCTRSTTKGYTAASVTTFTGKAIKSHQACIKVVQCRDLLYCLKTAVVWAETKTRYKPFKYAHKERGCRLEGTNKSTNSHNRKSVNEWEGGRQTSRCCVGGRYGFCPPQHFYTLAVILPLHRRREVIAFCCSSLPYSLLLYSIPLKPFLLSLIYLLPTPLSCLLSFL